MPEPRLTIGIPTKNRAIECPERLQRAVHFILGSSIPVKVIMADQGHSDECRLLCKEWEQHPHFKRIDSPATNLWENWRFVAETAADEGAEFFMWHQDDDLLSIRTARRVVNSFDHFTDATVYCSSLALAYDNLLGRLDKSNPGPRVPVDVLYGQPMAWPGNLLTIIGYVDSWAMSPAKAFRVNDQFRGMLATLPAECDCYTERLDIAACAFGHKFIVDPNRAGCWVIHKTNESQITGETQAAQVQPAYDYLDRLMDRIPDWRQELLGWMSCLGEADLIKTYYANTYKHADKSPYCAQIVNIFGEALEAGGMDLAKLRGETESVAA